MTTSERNTCWLTADPERYALWSPSGQELGTLSQKKHSM